MSPVQAVLLAAGKGERIAGIAGRRPKPLLKVNGVPVLVWNLKLLARHGIKEVWINLHHGARQIRRQIGSGKKWGIQVRYSYEKKILGTSGAVKKIGQALADRTFFVLYGDNVTDCDLGHLLKTHNKARALSTIAAYDPNKSLHSGIAGGRIIAETEERILARVEGRAKTGGSARADGKVLSKTDVNNLHGAARRIQKFIEGPGVAMKRGLVNAGIYVLEPEILRFIPAGFSDFGKNIFPALLNKKQNLRVFEMKGYCLAVDTPEAFHETQRLAENLLP